MTTNLVAPFGVVVMVVGYFFRETDCDVGVRAQPVVIFFFSPLLE